MTKEEIFNIVIVGKIFWPDQKIFKSANFSVKLVLII